jgi:hypothetical protein
VLAAGDGAPRKGGPPAQWWLGRFGVRRPADAEGRLWARIRLARVSVDPAIRFPGESDEYRLARNRLLEAEIELRRTIERVAAQRRALPPGGAVPDDYVFEEAAGAGGEVKSSRSCKS